MKSNVVLLLAMVLVAGLTFGFYAPSGKQSIALAVKVIHDVTRKAGDVDWASAKKGDVLYSGDQVRTGERSIAIVKFLDNSMLRVRESSELKLLGEQKDGIFNKTVTVTRGEFTFDIQKQSANEKFTFSSPTSVAAIRGTEGTMGTGADGADTLVVIDGLVNFLNSISNKTIEVGAGQTGISNPDGSITVRTSTPLESGHANDALNATHGNGVEKKLEMQLKDKDGNKKKLRIRYHD